MVLCILFSISRTVRVCVSSFPVWQGQTQPGLHSDDKRSEDQAGPPGAQSRGTGQDRPKGVNTNSGAPFGGRRTLQRRQGRLLNSPGPPILQHARLFHQPAFLASVRIRVAAPRSFHPGWGTQGPNGSFPSQETAPHSCAVSSSLGSGAEGLQPRSVPCPPPSCPQRSLGSTPSAELPASTPC